VETEIKSHLKGSNYYPSRNALFEKPFSVKHFYYYLIQEFNREVPALPFGIFRLTFGLLLFFGSIRFMYLGWIEDHYADPIVHFHYWGMSWIPHFSTNTLYIIHVLMALAGIGTAIGQGKIYRLSAIVLFFTFTYTELIDLTYYLNHYYYVSIVSFLLCLVPSPPPSWKKGYRLPAWVLLIFKLQLAIVYIYAGLAKINYDWLILALPLKMWLPAQDKIPVLGPLFNWTYAPYIFSWFGMLYDCTIVFFLMWKRTRWFAFIAVIVFHTLVGILFQIGVFPLVMITGVLIFFDFGDRLIGRNSDVPQSIFEVPSFYTSVRAKFLLVFFVFQLVFPWRYLLYDGNIFWTEEGYRFSWRVMLMEKAGTATFYVTDTKTGKRGIVDNREFLNPHQEKQMAMQPDMILQFAHFLGEHYESKGVYKPAVYAEVYVTLNARPSKLLIDPQVDLMKERDGFLPKKWILHD
jgi:hypothetical protein